MSRGGQLIDIGKNLDLQEIDPYPLKVFFNIVAEKLTQADKIMIITKEVDAFFLRNGIIKKICVTEKFDEKTKRGIGRIERGGVVRHLLF